ncbi:MAG: hypothetical protein FWC06_00290 [Treponema sp.]|nr:hypothetical protein [Treponema sp.]
MKGFGNIYFCLSRRIRKIIFCLLIFFIMPLSVSAVDLGLVTNLYTGFDGVGGDENTFEFKADIWPRLSGIIGGNGEFYLSAGLTLGVTRTKAASTETSSYIVPELLRTELSFRFGSMGIKFGRIFYNDPLSLIADGLFDGVQFNFNTMSGKFSAGAMYTGLLYKKNAGINLTDYDLTTFNLPLDYSDFVNTYFASKRIITAVEWDHPSIAEFLHLNISFLGQFDVNGADSRYNSQYFTLKAGIPFGSFLFEAGGSLGLWQSALNNNNKNGLMFAGDFGLFWQLPASFQSRLSLTARIIGGAVNDRNTAFTTVTGKYFGEVLKLKISGLSMYSLNYSARFTRETGFSLAASYFIRNDLGTVQGYPVSADSDGYFLGPELFTRFIWSPASDLQINARAGVFIPSMGNAGRDEKAKWRLELTVTISVF